VGGDRPPTERQMLEALNNASSDMEILRVWDANCRQTQAEHYACDFRAEAEMTRGYRIGHRWEEDISNHCFLKEDGEWKSYSPSYC
jgi:UDP-N-acetylmuramyl tripeptide synthase